MQIGLSEELGTAIRKGYCYKKTSTTNISRRSPQKKNADNRRFLKRLQHNDRGFDHLVNYTVIVGWATCRDARPCVSTGGTTHNTGGTTHNTGGKPHNTDGKPRNTQLLFTTHNINLLSEDHMRRDVVWFAEKSDLGETALLSLVDFKLHKNLSPLNACKTGKLGAKPHTFSVIFKFLDAENKTEITSFKPYLPEL